MRDRRRLADLIGARFGDILIQWSDFNRFFVVVLRKSDIHGCFTNVINVRKGDIGGALTRPEKGVRVEVAAGSADAGCTGRTFSWAVVMPVTVSGPVCSQTVPMNGYEKHSRDYGGQPVSRWTYILAGVGLIGFVCIVAAVALS